MSSIKNRSIQLTKLLTPPLFFFLCFDFFLLWAIAVVPVSHGCGLTVPDGTGELGCAVPEEGAGLVPLGRTVPVVEGIGQMLFVDPPQTNVGTTVLG
jgi:hypothetical protein